MPEVEAYKFSHKELTEILIKASDIHEGKWLLQVHFGFTAGNMGSDRNNVSPGTLTVVNHIGITRAKEDSPEVLVVDAEEVNPSST